MGSTPTGARQLIVHGHLSIGDHRVTRPGYLVLATEEAQISYAPGSPLNDEAHPIRVGIREQQQARADRTAARSTGRGDGRTMAKVGIVHIFASYNNIHITVTDITGAETLTKATGGMVVKAARDESSPYAAMKAADQVAAILKEKGYDTLHVRVRAPGGNRARSPAPAPRRRSAPSRGRGSRSAASRT